MRETLKIYSPNKNVLEKFHLCGPANKDSLSILDATCFGWFFLTRFCP